MDFWSEYYSMKRQKSNISEKFKPSAQKEIASVCWIDQSGMKGWKYHIYPEETKQH